LLPPATLPERFEHQGARRPFDAGQLMKRTVTSHMGIRPET
jgi:hypothetical protein